jgi:uncharacterized membrane protein YbhN (UPF0104 family)
MKRGKAPLGWTRLAGAALTAGALWLVLRRLRFPALENALRELSPGWFIAGVALYGTLFVPAAIRWHLLLRMTGTAIGPRTTIRVCLIGHLFYVLLFGAAGGDTARSALYARWYRQPLPAILATAPLDRFLGFIGLVVFGATAFAIAWWSGGFQRLGVMSFKFPVLWALALLVIVAFLAFLAWRARPGTFLGHFFAAVAATGRRLFASPRTLIGGATCGFLVQLALSGVLAVNLHAVNHGPVPWAQLVWVLPIIAVFGALPITFGGLGTREGAALALLGLYGIGSATAVAASLLTFATSLFWALVGAIILWREWLWRRQSAAPRTLGA